MKNPRLRKGAVVWSGRYSNGGVLRIARTVRNGQRLQHKVQNRKLWQGTVVRSCRYKKKGVLCTARTVRDGQLQEKKLQNPRLRKGAVVRSGRYKNGGVLCTTRTGRINPERYSMFGHTYSMDQPGKRANPVRGQLKRENWYFLVRVRG